MVLECQAPSCDHRFHDSVLDPFEAVDGGFEPNGFWEFHRPAPDGFGVESLAFCSGDCVAEWREAQEVAA